MSCLSKLRGCIGLWPVLLFIRLVSSFCSVALEQRLQFKYSPSSDTERPGRLGHKNKPSRRQALTDALNSAKRGAMDEAARGELRAALGVWGGVVGLAQIGLAGTGWGWGLGKEERKG
ncbi:hypothetical protein JAAARDRAFT_597210 [Jaapia argillacea MUCL 33604]|uniref:Uncharacterized protein n=1 Tax=Jaapia argillacea MUCL 33604 TaxID=933084 RepID=A0A067PZA4_9AGAM|nr:hypothetical protein JAAARDRAFT_597210 [Jaapia argillacea MUCL 33604]